MHLTATSARLQSPYPSQTAFAMRPYGGCGSCATYVITTVHATQHMRTAIVKNERGSDER